MTNSRSPPPLLLKKTLCVFLVCKSTPAKTMLRSSLRATHLANSIKRCSVQLQRPQPFGLMRFKQTDYKQQNEGQNAGKSSRRRVVMRNVLIGYAMATGIAVWWFYREYQQDPLRSIVDRVLRWWGGLYRDYLYIDRDSMITNFYFFNK
jgi:hypothetical protein